MRVGLIATGEADPDFERRFGGMHGLFEALLSHPDIELTPAGGFAGSYPSPLEAMDAYIVPGSLASARDDGGLVGELLGVIAEIHRRNIPLIGICFGHHAVARALGGVVRRRPSGWRVGMSAIEWLEGERPGRLRVYTVHSDEVCALPPGATHLARDEASEFEAFRVGDRVLCLQGHPEFSAEVAEYFLHRNDVGLNEAVRRQAQASLAAGDDHAAVGRILTDFLVGQARTK